jgi:hypothetical protein
MSLFSHTVLQLVLKVGALLGVPGLENTLAEHRDTLHRNQSLSLVEPRWVLRRISH